MDSLGRMFLLANLGTVSCLLFCAFLTENGWYGVDPANRICFKYNDKASTWWDAKRSCEQQGLFLARPDSESINTFLQVMKGGWKKPFFWIGGINDEDSGWKWTNGDDMDFNDFFPFLGTVNGIISFFKKSTYCAMFGYRSAWVMKSCDELVPFLCQSDTNSTSTPLKRAERYEQTTSTSSLKPKAISVEHHKRKMFKVQKMVGGRLNPKLINPGQNRTSAIDQLTCCRLCSAENGCELINVCKMSSSCVLYGNFDSAVSGGVTSEPGCSVYVDVVKLD